ncbi:MAG: hypothetical protein IKI23_13860 [Lachnospiraceae bacterium]|nr:hypothetical protein [Lachnospiraceae bacterium]
MMNYLKKCFLPLLYAAVLIVSWTGVSFSPGFSESFAAIFITAQAALLLFRNAFGRTAALLGSLFLAAGTYIYAAGDDHLSLCLKAALLGALVCGALQWKSREPFPERLLRPVLFGAGLFTVFCGFFSTALLPAGFGAMLCFLARYKEETQSQVTLAGLVLCSAFLLSPMCFPGGGPV